VIIKEDSSGDTPIKILKQANLNDNILSLPELERKKNNNNSFDIKSENERKNICCNEFNKICLIF
jgi:hypothetical protein